ncbi:hypothetical protein BH23ACT11_BH23ACT11_21790 [soil metagenome]
MKSNSMTAISMWLLVAFGLALLLVTLVFTQGASPARAEEETTVEGQVIGGSAVPNGKYPFVTAVLDRRAGGSAYQQQFCGGTLIDRNSVLTAAHCVTGARATHLRVTVGRTALKSNQGVIRKVRRIFIHPKYRSHSSRYDAAVLKLRGAVRNVAPIRIPGAKQNFYEKKGSRAIVAGWGNTIAQPASGYNGSNYPNRMQEAKVPIRTDRYGRSVYGSSYVPRLMIAAGRTGKDTCQGDSGGPLFKKRAGKFYQIGITSFGAGCGAKGYPGVYTESNAIPNRSFIMRASRQ